MSFRFRLTLMNVLVLAALLIAMGYAMVATTKTMVARSIDRDMMGRIRGFVDSPMSRVQLMGGTDPGEGAFGFGGQAGQNGQDGQGGAGGQGGRGGAGRGGAGGRGGGFGQGPGFGSGGPTGRGAGGQFIAQGPPGGRRGPERPIVFDLQAKSIGPDSGTSPISPPAYERALKGEEVYLTTSTDDGPVRVLYLPVYEDNRPGSRHGAVIGVGQLSYLLADSIRLEQSQLQTMLVLLPIALVVAFAAGWFLTSSALRPVEEVTAAAQRITDNDLGVRLPARGNDELAKLSRTFNGMLERLDAAFRRQRQFTADAAHELKTPIARIKLATSATLSATATPAELTEALVVADHAADAMNRLTQQLLTLARLDSGQAEEAHQILNLFEVVEEAIAQIPRGQLRIQLKGSNSTSVHASADELTRVFLNLFDNAIRYAPEDSSIVATVTSNGANALVQVVDHGPGVPPAQLTNLGQRFFRADSARNRKSGGSGLGLAIAKEIVESVGGVLRFSETYGGGLTATVELPISVR